MPKIEIDKKYETVKGWEVHLAFVNKGWVHGYAVDPNPKPDSDYIMALAWNEDNGKCDPLVHYSTDYELTERKARLEVDTYLLVYEDLHLSCVPEMPSYFPAELFAIMPIKRSFVKGEGIPEEKPPFNEEAPSQKRLGKKVDWTKATKCINLAPVKDLEHYGLRTIKGSVLYEGKWREASWSRLHAGLKTMEIPGGHFQLLGQGYSLSSDFLNN